MTFVAGVSASDCSASSSVSISYDDVSSGNVENNLLDRDANDRDDSDDDSEVLAVWPVLADKNAVLMEDVIAMLLLWGDERGRIDVSDDDAVASRAIVSDDRAGGRVDRVMLMNLLTIAIDGR